MSPRIPFDDQLTRTMFGRLAERSEEISIYRSEVPRRPLGEGGSWRCEPKRVRSLAAQLTREGRIVILRYGKPITGESVKGVIRVGRAPSFGGSAES